MAKKRKPKPILTRDVWVSGTMMKFTGPLGVDIKWPRPMLGVLGVFASQADARKVLGDGAPLTACTMTINTPKTKKEK